MPPQAEFWAGAITKVKETLAKEMAALLATEMAAQKDAMAKEMADLRAVTAYPVCLRHLFVLAGTLLKLMMGGKALPEDATQQQPKQPNIIQQQQPAESANNSAQAGSCSLQMWLEVEMEEHQKGRGSANMPKGMSEYAQRNHDVLGLEASDLSLIFQNDMGSLRGELNVASHSCSMQWQAMAVRARVEERQDLQGLYRIFELVHRCTVDDVISRLTIFDDISAMVENGEVAVAGKVTMPYKKNDLAKRIAAIDGVRAVRNDIDVLPVSQYDDELRYRVARAIYGNSSFWNYAAMANPPIHVIVERGRVTLAGVVNSNVERMLARSLATGQGEMSVTNSLRTDAEMEAQTE